MGWFNHQPDSTNGKYPVGFFGGRFREASGVSVGPWKIIGSIPTRPTLKTSQQIWPSNPRCISYTHIYIYISLDTSTKSILSKCKTLTFTIPQTPVGFVPVLSFRFPCHFRSQIYYDMRAVAWLMEICPRDVWECMENPPSFGGWFTSYRMLYICILLEMFIDFGTTVYN